MKSIAASLMMSLAQGQIFDAAHVTSDLHVVKIKAIPKLALPQEVNQPPESFDMQTPWWVTEMNERAEKVIKAQEAEDHKEYIDSQYQGHYPDTAARIYKQYQHYVFQDSYE
jgi:hypothetical protein